MWPIFIALASVMTQGIGMATPTTIADALEQTALNPKSASTDKGRVESHDINSLLAARRHEAANAAAAKIHCGIQLFKAESPGAG